MKDYKDLPNYESFYIDTPSDGLVRVTLGVNFRSVKLRSSSSGLKMSAPTGISYNQALASFKRMRPQLEKHITARPTYRMNQEIHYHEGKIIILPDDTTLEERHQLRSQGISVLIVNRNINFNNPIHTAGITRTIMRIAKRYTAIHIIPRANEIATKFGLKVRKWRIGSGLRNLGTCSHDRVITISAATLFLPPLLRDYIICHELAHLTEMNHSERFHQLLNSYLGGREAALVSALHRYPWPIIR